MTKRILVIPSVRQGNGTGHLERMISLTAAYPEQFALFLDREGELSSVPVADLDNFNPENEIDRQELHSNSWRYILLDQRETSVALFERLHRIAPLAGVDEGGAKRSEFDYLIDTLPRLDHAVSNFYNPELNPLPQNSHDWHTDSPGIKKLLITFGGQDPAGLTEPVVNTLISQAGIRPQQITAVRGPSRAPLTLPEGVRILNVPEDLRNRLADYDCCICSFGLTALESLSAGTPVITVNPARYHHRLAAKTGLPRAGFGKPSARRLTGWLRRPEILVETCRSAAAKLAAGDINLPDLASLDPADRNCAGCGSALVKVTARLPERTFYRCRDCGLLFQQPWVKDTTEYNEAYFFEEYRRQYGRSYLEDFNHIRDLGRSRLARIRIHRTDPTLLDIGCAYGPFLAAAVEAGYSVEGVEPAQSAAEYTRKLLNVPVHQQGLEEFARDNVGREWDVVTLWYVIEHFPDLEAVLKLLSTMVSPGGILAVGTPNGAGITARRRRDSFYRASPGDHYSILTPSSARRLLGAHGFRIEGFRAAGLYPGRFPALVRPFWRVVRPAAAALNLGDTFEIYARRTVRSDEELPDGKG